MSNLKSELWDLYDHMIQVPAVMRTTPNATDHHRRHADELAGAAAMCLEWADKLDEADPSQRIEPTCGTCKFWRPAPESGTGPCLWVIHQSHPWWLSKIKTMEYWWGTACRAYERKRDEH